jgi:twitching motility protein PilT
MQLPQAGPPPSIPVQASSTAPSSPQREAGKTRASVPVSERESTVIGAAPVAAVERDVAPPTSTNAGSSTSAEIPSHELAENFGTIDQIGDEPSVERAVIVSLPRHGAVDVDALLAKAKAERATDIHLVAGRSPMVRVGGELRPLGDALPSEIVAGVADSLIPASSAPHFRREGAAMFVVEHQTAGRLRVHVARARGISHVAIRFIPTNAALGALELPERAISLTRASHGLVLVTSPKGQGATTTAAAVVDAINESSARRVVVIDSPVEFIHPRKRSLVTHVDVGVHSRTFGTAVASAVKADADVICIGNVEDVATMRLALGAAEEGRLVIATMHARSTGRALERIVESFPVQEQVLARATLASTLRLVLGQRLVPSADRTKLHAAHEVLPESVALYTIIRDGKWSLLPTLLAKGRPLGVIRLEEALSDLVRDGEVPVDLARPLALSPNDFDQLVARPAGKKG